jgi:hypothetical protein
MKSGRSWRQGKLEEAFNLTELLVLQRQHNITPEEFQRRHDEILGPKRRSSVGTTNPVPKGELGPNGQMTGNYQTVHHSLAAAARGGNARDDASQLTLSHAGAMMTTAKAELRAPTGVGSSALFGMPYPS